VRGARRQRDTNRRGYDCANAQGPCRHESLLVSSL